MKKKQPKAKSVAPGSAGPMNVDFLQQLVNLMTANDLNTVDLREAGKRIILKRGAMTVSTPSAMTGVPSPALRQQYAPSTPSPIVDEDAGLMPIKSPMVGTFYSAPNPESKAFVQVGSNVVKDESDVCIIEAMKVFNNIKADVTGKIKKILVTNGQTVEFGTVLFLVKPN